MFVNRTDMWHRTLYHAVALVAMEKAADAELTVYGSGEFKGRRRECDAVTYRDSLPGVSL
jgi:hypothetical protein